MTISSFPAPLIYAISAVLGLVFGSLINVIVFRLPRMMAARWQTEAAEILQQAKPTAEPAALNLAMPGSRCPNCKTPIKPWHNVPVFGFLWLRGRCATCRKRISLQYPMIEIAAALLAVAAVARFGGTDWAICVVIASWLLLTLAAIDARTQLLPDSLTLSLLWLGLIASVLPIGGNGPSPTNAIIGAALGYGLLWLIFQIFLRLTGKVGMGHGDFKLAAALGAWLGWAQLPLALVIASLAGALVGGTLMASGRIHRGTALPFGPWLAAGGWLTLIAGDTILRTYLTFSGLR